MEQQHVGAYLEGQGGPPMMMGDGSQALFLRETQQWIISEDQVCKSSDNRCVKLL